MTGYGFPERVAKRVKWNGDCLEWQGCRTPKGYGQIGVNGRVLTVSRYVYAEVHGMQIPPGLFVCHTCDNPPCCNPEHLFLGTPADNTLDAMRKGRLRGNTKHRGILNPAARHEDSIVAEVIADYATGRYSQRELARRVGVHQSTIWKWIHGKKRALGDAA